ncbi:hypothetical protein ASG39_00030 [Rhizobium sp. Leaf371]|uniref:hypothetical protein n=1 Tax=Rhizobium sp. Leaf371 TaxID=1736355 RepID=UPI0007148D14|nr:hypothetical protein [Rhizobium sp. Leaf371]KQS72222.1 hypothetical protein ASG39_00030 [Rhizobium sp. Leaf371]
MHPDDISPELETNKILAESAEVIKETQSQAASQAHPIEQGDEPGVPAFFLDDMIKPMEVPVRPLGEILVHDDLTRYLLAIKDARLGWEDKNCVPKRIWTTDARFIRMMLGASDQEWSLIDHVTLSRERLEQATAEEIGRKIRDVHGPSLVEIDIVQLGEPLADALWRELEGWHGQTILAIVASSKQVGRRASIERIDELGVLQALIDVEGLSGGSTEEKNFREQASLKNWDSTSTSVLDFILTDGTQFEAFFEAFLEEPAANISPSRAAGQKLAKEALLDPDGILLPVAFALSQIEKIPRTTFRYLCEGFSARRATTDGPKMRVGTVLLTQLTASARDYPSGSYVQVAGDGRRLGMAETFRQGFMEAEELFKEIVEILVQSGVEEGFEFEAGRLFAKATLFPLHRTDPAALATGLEACLVAVLRNKETLGDREIAFRSVTAINGFMHELAEADLPESPRFPQLIGQIRFKQLSDIEDIERAIWISGSALAQLVVSHGYSLADIIEIDHLHTFPCFRGFFETLAEVLPDPYHVIALGLEFLQQYRATNTVGLLVAGMHLFQIGSFAYWHAKLIGEASAMADWNASVLNLRPDDLSLIMSTGPYFEPPFPAITTWIQTSVPTSLERKISRRYQVHVLDVRRARLVSPMVVAVSELLLSGQDDRVFLTALYAWARAHGAPNSAPNVRYISTWLKTTPLGISLQTMHAALEPFARMNRGLCLATLIDISSSRENASIKLKDLSRPGACRLERLEFREGVEDVKRLLHSVVQLYDAAKTSVTKSRIDKLVNSSRILRDRLSVILKGAY